MPGMVFHMMAYARTGNSPILAVLNDAAAITGCLRWNQTHDRGVFQQFSGYLLENGGEDIYKGMKNHLMVDEAMHGPKSPLYTFMIEIDDKLKKEENLYTSGENRTRMAELIAETGLDGVVREKNKELFGIIEQSQRDLDLERTSRLFAGFFRKDKGKLQEGLSFLKEIDFVEVASITGLAKAWLLTYKTAMKNLSELESTEVFQPWYNYLVQCFTDPDRMEKLRKLEEESKPGLRESYELSMNLDFHDS